jgi:hypothetical protein
MLAQTTATALRHTVCLTLRTAASEPLVTPALRNLLTNMAESAAAPSHSYHPGTSPEMELLQYTRIRPNQQSP